MTTKSGGGKIESSQAIDLADRDRPSLTSSKAKMEKSVRLKPGTGGDGPEQAGLCRDAVRPGTRKSSTSRANSVLARLWSGGRNPECTGSGSGRAKSARPVPRMNSIGPGQPKLCAEIDDSSTARSSDSKEKPVHVIPDTGEGLSDHADDLTNDAGPVSVMSGAEAAKPRYIEDLISKDEPKETKSNTGEDGSRCSSDLVGVEKPT